MVNKHPNPWLWAHMFRPSVHDRPPFPLSAKQRLYEIRKRHRKTEIRSEYLWAVDAELENFCDFCHLTEYGECIAFVFGGCPYAHERAVFQRRIETKARFHRLTRRERRYERRKRITRKQRAFRRAAHRARTQKLREKCLLRSFMLRLLLEMTPPY